MIYGPIKQSKDLRVGEVVRMLNGVFGRLHDEIAKTGKVPAAGIPNDFRIGYDAMTVMRLADPTATNEVARTMHTLERPYLHCDGPNHSRCGNERFDLPVTSATLWEVLYK